MFRSDGIFGKVGESGLNHRIANAATVNRGPRVRISPFPPYSRLAQRVERSPDKTEVTGAVPVSTTT